MRAPLIMTITRVVLPILALAFLLAGCGGQSNDSVRAYVKRTRSKPVKPIKPAPKIASYRPFKYEESDRRSPFAPTHPKKKQPNKAYNGPKPDPARPRGPLEKYSLDGLKMMGTVTSGPDDYALVRTPTGVIYRVKQGQYLGRHSGKIIDIRPDGLVIREIVPKSAGGYQKRTTTLAVGQ